MATVVGPSTSQDDVALAIADIRSGSPELLVQGLRSIHTIFRTSRKADGAVAAQLPDRLADEGLVRSLLEGLQSSSLSSDGAEEICWAFALMSTSQESCELLFSLGAQRVLLDFVTLASLKPSKAAENAIMFIGNSVIECDEAAMQLVDADFYHKVVKALTGAVADVDGLPHSVLHQVLWLLGVVLDTKPAVPFSVVSSVLPPIASLLQARDPRLAEEPRCLDSMAHIVAAVFNDAVRDADWTLLHSTGVSAHLDAFSRVSGCAPALLHLLVSASKRGRAVADVVFADGALAWLAASADDDSLSDESQSDLLSLLGELAVFSAEMRGRMGRAEVFGSLLRRATARAQRPAPGSIAWPPPWAILDEAGLAMFNMLHPPAEAAAAAAPALMRAGAVELIATALAHPMTYEVRWPVADGYTLTMQRLIEQGSTARDEAYIAGGGALSNEYLAAFCAAGGGAALKLALEFRDQEASGLVLKLFNSVIGPIVGADGPAEAPGGVPAAFQALIDLGVPAPQ